MRAELRDPVIVGAETGPLQVSVFKTEQRHAERGVEHLGLDAVDLLVFDPLDWVPAARTGGLIALGQMVFEFLARPAGAKATGHRKRLDPLGHKEAAGLIRILDQLRRTLRESVIE